MTEKIIYTLILSFVLNTAYSRTFIHPGISHKLSDLERMKINVALNKDPWKTSFTHLQSNGYASYNYSVRWSLDSTRVVEGWSSNYEKFKYDALACYYNALQWYITADVRYALKSVEILNKMKNIRSIVSATQSLAAGRVLPKLLEAAEIIKHTYSGWSQTDQVAFAAMLVYPGYSTTVDHSTDAEHSFYWAMYNGDYGRHGNQGLFGMLGTIQIAVFTDNEIMYDRILRYLTGQSHRSDDLPYVPGPPKVSSTKNASASNSYYDDYSMISPYFYNTQPDYGYNEVIGNYIWENGQTQEASRDQSHAQLALGLINNICEIAWNQGDDLYSTLNNRLLLGWEYYFKYNLSYYTSYADQPTAWEPTAASGEFIQRRDRSQRWYSKKINPWNANDTLTLTRATMFSNNAYTTSTGTKTPMYEMALGHFKDRLALPATNYKWLSRADNVSRNKFGYERQGFQVDYLGFGGLTFHRIDSCAGDPVTFVNKSPVYAVPTLSGTIQAEDFDYMPSNAQNRAYFDLSSVNTTNDYRPDGLVNVAAKTGGGYKITALKSGEWLNYTVKISATNSYKIKVNYSANASGGKLKFAFNGSDKTSEVNLPSTGNDVWSDYTIATGVDLSEGIQSMRVFVSGTDNVLELNAISLDPSSATSLSLKSGDWSDPTVWSTGAVPTSDDAVTLTNGHAITMTSSGACHSLLINGTTSVPGTSYTSGASLNVNQGKNLTVATSMTNNGTINLLSGASGNATLLTPSSISGTGRGSVQQHLPSARNWYVSSPITNAKAIDSYTFYDYNEANASWTTMTTGDGTTTGDALVAGKGYIANLATGTSTHTFTGSLNNGDVPIVLNRDGTTKAGFNLVGNPYPSHITWTNAIATAANTLPTIWYRTKVDAAYAFHTYNAALNEGSPITTDGVIAPMQAFWVRANADNTTLTFTNAMRSHGGTSHPLKAPALNEIAKLRLQVSNGVNTDETLIAFTNNASDAFDLYDSPKMFNNLVSIPEIYTLVGTEKLVINGMNNVTDSLQIPIGMKIGQTGSYSLKMIQLENLPTGFDVYLLDNQSKIKLDLNRDYVFTSDIVDDSSRFSLLFEAPSTLTNLATTDNNKHQVFVDASNHLQIISSEKIKYFICNSLGQLMISGETNANDNIIRDKLQAGVYLVKLNDNCTKVIIK